MINMREVERLADGYMRQVRDGVRRHKLHSYMVWLTKPIKPFSLPSGDHTHVGIFADMYYYDETGDVVFFKIVDRTVPWSNIIEIGFEVVAYLKAGTYDMILRSV